MIKFNYNKLKSNVLDFVLTKLLDYMSKNSNITKFAKEEFKLLDYYDGDRMNALMAKQVIQLLQLFSTHGHSGFSARFAINLFDKLAMFQPLSQPTLKDDEFIANDLEIGTWQNKRDSKIFKDDEGIHRLDSFKKKIILSKKYNTNDIVKGNYTIWSGQVCLMKDGVATGLAFHRIFFKDEDIIKSRFPSKTIILPVTEVEVNNEDWLMFVEDQNAEFQELCSLYRIKWYTINEIADKTIISLKDIKI